MLIVTISKAQDNNKPVKIGIAGLTHGHAKLVFKFLKTKEIEIVGIAEPNTVLKERYKKQFNLADALFFTSIEDMLKESKPEGVAVFTNTKQHLEVVKMCAPKGIHVMVEKPLAVNYKEALTMHDLSKQYGIHVITNYETTWHPALIEAQEKAFEDHKIGDLKKVVFHHGNNGTIRGKGNDEFIDWLTDPVKNGGGAIMDFGCYGANIITWFNKGTMPSSVYAVTNQYKPELYPKVDDDALILLEYPNYQSILMASWNWVIPRKDVEIYGNKGFIKVENSESLSQCYLPKRAIVKEAYTSIGYPINEPFNFFADIIKGTKKIEPFSPVSIENNLIVMKILDAARESAKKGEKINF
ncbi:Gfo/Idh/MocA family oxidoreductase [Tamlana sp. 2201CG12-4]|nr:Gfo/Idh/MocA family oxidoreductase [Tamlana sp. 2201CG12-4]